MSTLIFILLKDVYNIIQYIIQYTIRYIIYAYISEMLITFRSPCRINSVSRLQIYSKLAYE